MTTTMNVSAEFNNPLYKKMRERYCDKKKTIGELMLYTAQKNCDANNQAATFSSSKKTAPKKANQKKNDLFVFSFLKEHSIVITCLIFVLVATTLLSIFVPATLRAKANTDPGYTITITGNNQNQAPVPEEHHSSFGNILDSIQNGF